MTDPTTPQMAPTPPARPSRTRRILIIAIAVVVAIAAYFGTQFVLHAINDPATPAPSETAEDEADGYKPYTSEADGFSVTGPGTAQRSESTQTVEGVEITQSQTAWTDGGASFIVGSAGLPDSDASIDEVLEGSLSGMTDAIAGSTVRESERITVHGEPAVAGVLDIDGSPSYQFLIVLHNGRQFVLLANELDDSRDEDFLASFDFTS